MLVMKDRSALTRRRLTAGGLGAAWLAACGPSSPPASSGAADGAAPAGAKPTATGGKSMVVAVEADLSSFRPDRFGPFMDRYINRALYDTLLHFKVKQTAKGAWYDSEDYEFRLASGMTVTPDGKTITYAIRDNAAFQNGKKITAETVAKSWQWFWDTGGAGKGQLISNGLVSKDDIRADGNKVVVSLKEPTPWGAYAAFVDLISIIDVEEVMKNATAEDPLGAKWIESNANASGPYVIEKRTKGEQTVVAARPNYHAAKPSVERVIFQVVPDPSVRYSMLKRGDVDMVSLLDFKDLKEAQADKNIAVESWDGNNWTVLGLNWKEPEFQDKNVRKAIASAVPSKEIIDSVYYGFANEMKAPWGTTVSGAEPSTWPYTFDLARAKAFLSQSAYANGFSKTLALTNADPNWEKAAQIIADSLGKIGIKLTIEKQTTAQIATGMAQRKVGMGINAFTPFVHDPGYHVLWTQLPESGANWFDYKNPEAEAIARRFLYLKPNDAARQPLLKRYQEILAEDVFAVPICSMKMVVPHRKNVSGFAFLPDQPTAFRFERLTLS